MIDIEKLKQESLNSDSNKLVNEEKEANKQAERKQKEMTKNYEDSLVVVGKVANELIKEIEKSFSKIDTYPGCGHLILSHHFVPEKYTYRPSFSYDTPSYLIDVKYSKDCPFGTMKKESFLKHLQKVLFENNIPYIDLALEEICEVHGSIDKTAGFSTYNSQYLSFLTRITFQVVLEIKDKVYDFHYMPVTKQHNNNRDNYDFTNRSHKQEFNEIINNVTRLNNIPKKAFQKPLFKGKAKYPNYYQSAKQKINKWEYDYLK